MSTPFHTLTPGSFEVGPFQARVEAMNHPVETYGLRLEHDGAVLAYSADTGECEALRGLARGADLFLCEASYLESRENPPGLHLTGGRAGEYAAEAGVGQLVLTHLVDAWGDEEASLREAREAFAGPVTVAATGARYTLGG
jgi:ribonuclease BN (tRNA processing enzyme)